MTPAETDRPEHLGNRGRLLLAVVIAVGIAVRVVALDRLPGLNGDEAWYGVNVHEFLQGQAYALRTPGRNLLNPFHSGTLLGLSLVAEPSFVLLRMPAELWGIGTVLAAYPLLSAPIGARAALMTTAILALSPTAVSQSRFGWDPSGNIFFTLLIMVAVLRDRVILAGLAGFAALVVHPTNVFVAPMAAVAWTPHALARYGETLRLRRGARIAIAGAATVALVTVYPLARALAHRGVLSSVEMVLERTFSPAKWMELGLGLVRLFSGITVSTSIAGPMDPGIMHSADVATILVFVIPIAAGWRGMTTARSRWAPWLLGGVAVGAVVFHIVAGPATLQPSNERYALSFVVPLALCCAVGTDALWSQSRRTSIAVGVAVVGLLGTILSVGYFRPLVTAGGSAHDAFRTGPVEPKAAAFRFIQEDSRNAEVVAIFCESWWLYWPLRYLANQPRFHVEELDPSAKLAFEPLAVRSLPYPHSPDKVYTVVFASSTRLNALRTFGPSAFTAADPLGRPILFVFAIRPDARDRIVAPAPWPPPAAIAR